MAVVISSFDAGIGDEETTPFPTFGVDPIYSPSSGIFAGLASPITNACQRNVIGSLSQARAEVKRQANDTVKYRGQLETDIDAISNFIGHDHEKEVANDRVLHHLAYALHNEIDNENDLAADVTSSILKDEDAIKQIIEDTKILSVAEKADLVIEQISSYATIARDTANLVADAAEVVPFGSSVAGVIRTGADTADLVAETATTIKRSGITRSLSKVITNLHTGELSPQDILTQSMTIAKDVDSLVREVNLIPARRERRLDLTFAAATDPTPVIHDSEYYAQYGVEDAAMCYVLRDTRSPYYTRVRVDNYGFTYEVIRRQNDGVRMSNGSVILSGTKKLIPNKAEMHCIMALCMLFGGLKGLNYNVHTVRGVLETLVASGIITREALTNEMFDTYIMYKSMYDHDDAERFDHNELVAHYGERREQWKANNPDRLELIPKDSRTKFTDQIRSANLKLLFLEGNGYSVYGCRYGSISKAGSLKVAYVVGGCDATNKAIVQMATQKKNFVSIVSNEDVGTRTFTISNNGGLSLVDGDMIFFRIYVKDGMLPRLYMHLENTVDGFETPVVSDNHSNLVSYERPYKHRYINVPELISAASVTTGAVEWTDYTPPDWTKVPAAP
uniref:VP4 n=1 Tax=viral metagenome TaxID=1070528 RepID=A0A2V0RGT8_9ZZZZ